MSRRPRPAVRTHHRGRGGVGAAAAVVATVGLLVATPSASACAMCPVEQVAPSVATAKIAVDQTITARYGTEPSSTTVRCNRRTRDRFSCSWSARGLGSDRLTGRGTVRFTMSTDRGAEYRYAFRVRVRTCNPHRPDVCQTRTKRWNGAGSI